MHHPFAGNLSDKTMEELMESISKLSKQQQYMFRIGKHEVVKQINMLLTAYRDEYSSRQTTVWNKKYDSNLDKNIDIQ